MASLAGLALAHGSVTGLIVESAAAVAITALMLWSFWKARRAHNEDEGDP